MEEEIRLIIQNLGISIGANLLYDIGKTIVKLLPHQESNLTKWIQYWQPKDEDLDVIKNNDSIKRVVSILFEKAENEIFEEKLSTWGKITDSVIRNIKPDISYDLYFIKVFSDMPLSVIYYLLNIYKTGEAEVISGYPVNDNKKQEDYFCSNYCTCLSLTECFSGKHKLTEFGKQFINFIGNSFQSIK